MAVQTAEGKARVCRAATCNHRLAFDPRALSVPGAHHGRSLVPKPTGEEGCVASACHQQQAGQGKGRGKGEGRATNPMQAEKWHPPKMAARGRAYMIEAWS